MEVHPLDDLGPFLRPRCQEKKQVIVPEKDHLADSGLKNDSLMLNLKNVTSSCRNGAQWTASARSPRSPRFQKGNLLHGSSRRALTMKTNIRVLDPIGNIPSCEDIILYCIEYLSRRNIKEYLKTNIDSCVLDFSALTPYDPNSDSPEYLRLVLFLHSNSFLMPI